MSTSSPINTIEYPESDGHPMGETDLHIEWTFRLRDMFKQRYRGQQVYVAANLLVYYEEGCPTRFVVPDCFLVFDSNPEFRRTYRIWDEGKPPQVVFEITSRSTGHKDLVDKAVLYEQLGVEEYFLYDPNGQYLTPPLQGYRAENGVLTQIDSTANSIRSQQLGVDLSLVGRDLVMIDFRTGQKVLTAAEAADEVAEEAKRNAQEFQRNAQEAEARAESEKRARIEIEAQLRQSQEELKRLRGE